MQVEGLPEAQEQEDGAPIASRQLNTASGLDAIRKFKAISPVLNRDLADVTVTVHCCIILVGRSSCDVAGCIYRGRAEKIQC